MGSNIIGAVDIGGTKILVGIADGKGNIISSQSFPTKLGDKGAEESVIRITQLLNQQRQEKSAKLRQLSRIGVVCAGPVDTKGGIVQNPYTLPGWDGFPLSKRLSESTGVPVIMENDANGALIGEVAIRDLNGSRVLMVTVGTGIGVAFMDHGRLYRPSFDYHPEMGHIVVSSRGDRCYCGQVGCFESVCSGTAVNKRAKEAGCQDFDDLLAAGGNGNLGARVELNHISEDFSRGLWNLCVIFRPNVVILGGGIMDCAYSFFEESFLSFADGREDFVGSMRVLQSEKTANSALVGAVCLGNEVPSKL